MEYGSEGFYHDLWIWYYLNKYVIILLSISIVLSSVLYFNITNPRWHQWNNIKTARYIVVGTVIFWILHEITFTIYYNHILSPMAGVSNCIITNAIFQQYRTIIFVSVLINTLPLIIMILFEVLTSRNVQQIAYRTVPLVRRELDKQLTVMVLVQVFYNVFPILPTIIQTIFSFFVGTSPNAITDMQENFIANVTFVWYYFYFVMCMVWCKSEQQSSRITNTS